MCEDGMNMKIAGKRLQETNIWVLCLVFCFSHIWSCFSSNSIHSQIECQKVRYEQACFYRINSISIKLQSHLMLIRADAHTHITPDTHTLHIYSTHSYALGYDFGTASYHHICMANCNNMRRHMCHICTRYCLPSSLASSFKIKW